MDKAKLKEFKEILEGRRAAILENAGETVTGMGGGSPNFADPTDRAELETSRNFTLRIRDRERKLLYKIEEALERIGSGGFAVCELCGGGIEEARLRARPVTTKCIECKQEEERAEKLRRG